MSGVVTHEGQRISVRFPARPPREVIRDMRSAGFTWSPSKRVWFADYSDEAEQAATDIVHSLTAGAEAPAFEATVNSILHGDCAEVLAELPEACVDLVLTDPPYLVNYKDRTGRAIRNDRDAAWLQPSFDAIARVMKPDTLMLSFYGWNTVDLFMAAWRNAGLRPVGHLVGRKSYASSNGFFRHCHEQAYLLAKGDPAPPDFHNLLEDVRSWKYTGNRIHPTQKPTGLLKDIVRCFCPQGGVVLDPFAGSGSTCIAAAQAGRRFIGVEIDNRYHASACRRLSVFDEKGRDEAA